MSTTGEKEKERLRERIVEAQRERARHAHTQCHQTTPGIKQKKRIKPTNAITIRDTFIDPILLDQKPPRKNRTT